MFSKKSNKFVKHERPFKKPCLLSLINENLSKCFMISSFKIDSIILHMKLVKLTGLSFCASDFLPFLNNGVTPASLQTLGTEPLSNDELNNFAKGLASSCLNSNNNFG